VEARALMLKGVEDLADAVKVTMGPKVTKQIFNFLYSIMQTCLFLSRGASTNYDRRNGRYQIIYFSPFI
jgi:hypothetical protein